MKYARITAIVLFGIMLYFAAGLRNTLIYTVGLAMGFFFVYGSIGFTRSWRSLILTGNPSSFYGQLILLACGIIVFIPILNLYPTLHKTVAPITWASMFGAILFGIGMQLGDGCGSGTIVKLGYNRYSRAVIFPFIIGSFLGSLHVPGMMRLGGLPAVDLGARYNIVIAIIIQMGILASVFLLVQIWKRYKKWNEAASWKQSKVLYLSMLALVPLSLAYLLLSGQPWGISYAFGLWGAKIANWIGIAVVETEYWAGEATYQSLSSSVIFDTTSLANFGLILGAWGSSRQKTSVDITCKASRIGGIAGGFLMGYGAQLAFGCNIGPYFSGISSGSLHGWSWFVFAITGTVLGIFLRKRLGYRN